MSEPNAGEILSFDAIVENVKYEFPIDNRNLSQRKCDIETIV